MTSKNEINICTFNIISGGNARLESAMRMMNQMNVDLGILTETKLVDGYHTRRTSGYDIITTEAKSQHIGGVALFYRINKNWHIEGTKAYGPNVIGAELVSGKKRWKLIGAYIPPSETDNATIDQIQRAAASSAKETPIILLGDLNVALKNTWNRENNERQEETLALVASLGLTNLGNHFVLARKRKDWTWSKRNADGTRHRSVCDYILVENRSDFTNFKIKQPRFDSDHRLLKATLKPQQTREHQKYLKKRQQFPIKVIPDNNNQADTLMTNLEARIKPTKSQSSRDNSWISNDTWKLIDRKAMARRSNNQPLMKGLGKEIRKNLQNDRKIRINNTAGEIEMQLKNKNTKEAYARLQSWYKKSTGKIPKPTYHDEEKTRDEFQALYTANTPPGNPILPQLQPQPTICDEPPTENEIKIAIKGMKLNKAPGASGIKAEHLKAWMEGATKEDERTYVDEWNMVVKLVKMAFSGDDIPSSFCNGILVLIPKNTSGEYRGIALLETIYKLVSSIINRRLIQGIRWHDSVHGFRKGRGTTTAIIEAKLRMQLAQRSHAPLYMIFLDLKKAYDTLNRERTIIILGKYGVGKNITSFITRIWEGDTIVPKQSGFYGKPFKATRGVRQGDIMSPTIFNIIVDAVIREWENNSAANQNFVENLFYADDGLIMSEYPEEAQTTLNFFTDGFARIGLKMNEVKTEAMVIQGGKICGSMSQEAYDRRTTGVGTTHRERSLQKVQCELCGETVNRQHIPKHQQTVKCKNNRGNYVHHCNKPEIAETKDINVETKHYKISVTPGKYSECPAENCKKKEKSAGEMRRHFRNRHWNDIIEIQEEGLLPQCSKCLLFQSCVDEKHQNTLDCKRFTKIKDDREKASIQQKAPQQIFYVNGTQIKMVNEFKYLGRILSNTDTDTAAMNYNLQRAREKSVSSIIWIRNMGNFKLYDENYEKFSSAMCKIYNWQAHLER